MQEVDQKKDRALTTWAFDRLLDWLDEGADSAGRKYQEMRERLVAYFDRKNCAAPDELADETLDRVARRLDEEGVIECDTPAKYCYTVARFVFMEHLRAAHKHNALLADLRRKPRGDTPSAPQADDEKERREKMLNCLEQCAAQLEPLNRELSFRYYTGQERVKIENRRALAEELGVTMNALSVRAMGRGFCGVGPARRGRLAGA